MARTISTTTMPMVASRWTRPVSPTRWASAFTTRRPPVAWKASSRKNWTPCARHDSRHGTPRDRDEPVVAATRAGDARRGAGCGGALLAGRGAASAVRFRPALGHAGGEPDRLVRGRLHRHLAGRPRTGRVVLARIPHRRLAGRTDHVFRVDAGVTAVGTRATQ